MEKRECPKPECERDGLRVGAERVRERQEREREVWGLHRNMLEDKACSLWQHRVVSIHRSHSMPELVTVHQCVADAEKRFGSYK